MGLMLNLGLRKLWQYNFGSPMLPIFTCLKKSPKNLGCFFVSHFFTHFLLR